MNNQYEHAQKSRRNRVPLMEQYHPTPEFSASYQFNLRPEELQLLFERKHVEVHANEGEKRPCIEILEKVGLTDGLLDSLSTDIKTGIIGDVKDIARRRKIYGENKFHVPPHQSFWKIFKDTLNGDDLMKLLLYVATISLVISFLSSGDGNSQAVSYSIYIAVLFLLLVQTSGNIGKEKQFRNLYKQMQNQTATVFRGSLGLQIKIPARDLVVGDIILLNQGECVPADCILAQEMDMTVDESFLIPANSKVEKQCLTEHNILKNPDPLLLQGSMILTGMGRAVVCAVGVRSMRWNEVKDQEFDFGGKQTLMQKKLETYGELLSIYAFHLSLLVLLILSFWQVVSMIASGQSFVSPATLTDIISNIQITIALIIVCVPEGLPLAISMSLAFSLDKLIDRNILIRQLEGLEISGQVLDVLTGCSSLTQGDMKVDMLYAGQGMHTTNEIELNLQLLDFITQTLILITDAHMEITDDSHMYVPCGNEIEVALMKFLTHIDVPIHDKLVEREKDFTRYAVFPFDPFRGTRTVAYSYFPRDEQETVIVICMGTPEKIVAKCIAELNQNYETVEFDGAGYQGVDYLKYTISDQMASTGRKPISLAYKLMYKSEFDQLKEYQSFDTNEGKETLEQSLTLLASFGFNNPPRTDAADKIGRLFLGSTNTRIVTGDHKDVAVHIARELNIIPADSGENNVFSATEIMAKINEKMEYGPDLHDETGTTEKWQFKDPICKKHFKADIGSQALVIYRATPHDKFMITLALREMGSFVAVTGEDSSDLQAMRQANVSFCMGSGCAVAKQSSGLIIMNNNYEAIFDAIKWGRNIFDNCRKFIQFQLTVNISCMGLVLISVLSLGSSPFTVMQLLWINLIMDMLAAIALATEAPHPTEIRKERIKLSDKFVIPIMWRQIFSQVIYQALAMLTLLYFGPMMFGIEYNLVAKDPFYVNYEDGTKAPTYRLQHMTLLFHTFVLMNIFNMFNCRKIGNEENPDLNVFQFIHHNWWFLIVLLGELNVQYMMVGYPSTTTLFMTAQLTFGMHLTAFLLGLGSLLVAFGVKKTPFEWTLKIPQFEEEQKDDMIISQIDGFFEGIMSVFKDPETPGKTPGARTLLDD